MTNSNSETFNKLTPCSNPDEALGEYKAAFLFALSEPDIKNIAVTGSYGSGKSSVIKSFEKYCDINKDKRYKFLNISLASFNIETKTPANKNPKESKHETAEIEKSLLQQIIFKVKSSDLEDSQFSRLKIKRYKCRLLISHFWTAFFVVSFLLSLKFIFKPDYFLFDDSWLFKKEYSWYFELVALIGGLGIIQLIMIWVPKLGLSKLSAGGAEISFNENKGDSILNKYLDELIYFFVATDYNIVVFEDLDRLPSREILIKLREINQLLNNSDEINNSGQSKVIKFIYALGDDLFIDPIDRTKFFDFIIPIIPVVNSSNSHEKLKQAIDTSIKDIHFKESFLEEVTQFIDDMRLLFNIANEFVIYKKSLNRLTLDNTKLLALIIYKNKYPNDFAQLNQKKGIVWQLLSKKQTLIEHLTKKFEAENLQLKNEEIQIESEFLKTTDELKRCYLSVYLIKHPNLTHFELNGNRYSTNEMVSDDGLFELLISSSNFRFYDYTNTIRALETFNVIEKEVHTSLTYKERKEVITKKANGTLNSITLKRSQLEKQIEDIQSLKLKELILRAPDQAFDKLETTNEKIDISLIRFLIQDGYIDEDYSSYITYFYPGELTANDQQFVLNQLSNTPLDLDYHLDNPEKVSKKIRPERFKNKSIFNLDILTYISFNHSNTDKFKNLVKGLLEFQEDGENVLYQWFKLSTIRDQSKKNVLNEITYQNAYYWSNFYENSQLSESEKDSLTISLLEHLDEQSLVLINKTEFIQNFLFEKVHIFNDLSILDYIKLERLFHQLDVKFLALDNCTDQELLKVIVKTDAYVLSEHNLIKALSDPPSLSTISPSYSYILQSDKKPIQSYIEREINSYVEDVLLKLVNIEESESAISTLLNNNDVENELKSELIKEVNFSISKIDLVSNKELWSDILEFNKVEATWINVIKYFTYMQNEIDEILLAFITSDENIDNLIKTNLVHDNPEHVLLAKQIIVNGEINVRHYKKLIRAIRISYNYISDFENISSEKLLILLNDAVLSLNLENHDFLKSALPDHSFLLIEQNFEEYIKNTSDYELTSIELVALVNSNKISDQNKLLLIESIAETRYDTDVAKAVCGFVLYKTTDKIFSPELVQSLFELKIGFELKVKLFNRYYSTFTTLSVVKKVISKIERLAMLKYQNNRVQIEKTEDNLSLANLLKINDLINFGDFRKDNSKIELRSKKKMWS